MLKQIENKLVKWLYNLNDKRTPVGVGDLVRHKLTGWDGNVIGIQHAGVFRPKCYLTVSNNLTGRFISNIDRNEFTLAVTRNLIDLSGGFKATRKDY